MVEKLDLDKETQAVFLFIKPICVQLLNPDCWISGQSLKDLEKLQHAILEASKTDLVIVDRLFKFASFPIISGLELKRTKDKSKEAALRLLGSMLRFSNKLLAFDDFIQLLQMLPFILTFGYIPATNSKDLKKGNVVESLLYEALKLWQELVEPKSSEDSLFREYWRKLVSEQRFEPLVAHFIYTLLELLKDRNTSVELQLMDLHIVEYIFECLHGNEALQRKTLPGALSALTKAISEDKEQRPRHSRVLAKVLALWRELAINALELLDAQDKVFELSNVLSWLNQHESELVRAQLVQIHATLALNTKSNARLKSVDIILASCRDSKVVSSHFVQFVNALCNCESNGALIEQRLLHNLSRLDLVLGRASVSPWHHMFALRTIIGGFEAILNCESSDINIVSSLFAVARSQQHALLSFVSLKSLNVALVQEQTPLAVFDAKHVKPVYEWYKYFPHYEFVHIRNIETEALTREALGLWSHTWYKYSQAFDLYEFYVRIVQDASADSTATAAIIVLNCFISRGLSLKTPAEDFIIVETQESEQLVAVLESYIQIYRSSLLKYGAKLAYGRLSGSKKQAACEAVALLLEGLTCLVGLLPLEAAQVQLVDLGLLFLAHWISPVHFVSQAADAALKCIAWHLNYTSPCDLVTCNIDYIVNSIHLNIADPDTAFESLRALEAAIKIAGSAISSRLEDSLIKSAELFGRPEAGWANANSDVLLQQLLKVTNSFFCLLSASTATPKPVEAPRTLNAFDKFNVGAKLVQFALELESSKVPVDVCSADDSVKAPTSGSDEAMESESLPNWVDLVAYLVERIVLLIDHSQPHIRVLVLENMRHGFPLVVEYQSVLLPLIHDCWSGLVSKLLDEEHFIVLEALETLTSVARLGKRFASKKVVSQVLPSLEKVLQYCAKAESLAVQKPSKRYGSRLLPSTGKHSTLGAAIDWRVRSDPVMPATDSVKLLCTSSAKSLAEGKKDRKTYKSSFLYKLQISGLELLGVILQNSSSQSSADVERMLVILLTRLNSRVYVSEIVDLSKSILASFIQTCKQQSISVIDILWFYIELILGNCSDLPDSVSKYYIEKLIGDGNGFDTLKPSILELRRYY